MSKDLDYVIIDAGPAGLQTAYYLKKAGLSFKATGTVDLPRRRDVSAPEYLALRDQILFSIEFGSAYNEPPCDVPVATGNGRAPRKQTVEFDELDNAPPANDEASALQIRR